MIVPTKKRLAIIFTSVILIFNAIILILSYVFLHQSIMGSAKRHMREDIRIEFLDQYRRSGLDPIKNLWDEHLFQILNREGAIVVSSRNSGDFYPEVNPVLLKKAFSGKDGFSVQKIGSTDYLISYFSLDGTYVGRAALSLAESQKYEKNFLDMILVALPGMVFLSYLTSRFLVNHAMEKISDFFTFQETFSSNVTHELRSPLASLKGNLEVTLRKERSIEDYKDTLQLSLKEVDRIIGLLNNLYLLASSKFKPLDLFKNEVDIVKIVASVAQTYAAAMADQGIKFTLSETDAALCHCDEALIRRTIENLLDNAVKYTPVNGSISMSVQKDEKKISMTITNTCKALERNDLKHIFDPFYRGRNTKNAKIEGKGLGLYISRYIIRSHGGDIKVNNTYGNLFSLTVSIPLK
ncbi:MAG: GHKL domain-containing protein [Nitrospirae bacterium]|nr:GHKL domain-containing protein [Nitrospirota bacterium]